MSALFGAVVEVMDLVSLEGEVRAGRGFGNRWRRKFRDADIESQRKEGTGSRQIVVGSYHSTGAGQDCNSSLIRTGLSQGCASALSESCTRTEQCLVQIICLWFKIRFAFVPCSSRLLIGHRFVLTSSALLSFFLLHVLLVQQGEGYYEQYFVRVFDLEYVPVTHER